MESITYSKKEITAINKQFDKCYKELLNLRDLIGTRRCFR